MKHNYNQKDMENTTESAEVQLTYPAPSTNDELQDMITKSESCHQVLSYEEERCLEGLSWISLSKDKWSPTSLNDMKYAPSIIYLYVIYKLSEKCPMNCTIVGLLYNAMQFT